MVAEMHVVYVCVLLDERLLSSACGASTRRRTCEKVPLANEISAT
jgi:hypothetical protein